VRPLGSLKVKWCEVEPWVSRSPKDFGRAPHLWYSDSHWAQASKMASFTSPAKEFRLTYETFRFLNGTSRGKRVVSCMMNRSQRHNTAMIRGEKDGAPNIIGIGWKRVIDMICRKCRLISDMTSRGG
jgi:hypothetical protein